MWIYNDLDWPHFTWDLEALMPKLSTVRHQQGILLGKLGSLGLILQQEASLNTLTTDVLTSSAIEGEILDREEVRSSVARRLGMEVAGLVPASRHVEGVVAMMLDATQQCFEPLTQERLFNWHGALFPTGRSGLYSIIVASWRQLEDGPMQVVSGPVGREKVHFEAPSADRVASEMEAYLLWLNQENNLDPIVKAGIAHLWFLMIHPFEDGNGRIARAISDYLLARGDGTADRFYSVSSEIERQRKYYYRYLERQQRGTLDITTWLLWFVECVEKAIGNADSTLSHVLFKADVWERLGVHPANERQKQVLNRMLEESFEGYMNTSKYAKLAKCSTDTAFRDIQHLVSWGVLLKNPGGGRSTSYSFLRS